MGEIQPAICFCSLRAENGFYVVKWFKQRSSVFWHIKSIWNSSFSSLIKFCCSTAMFICLHIVCGCFCPVVAKLSSCDWDRMACKTEILSNPLQKVCWALVYVCKREGVNVVMSGVLGLLWSSVINRSAKILNLLLKSGLAVELFVTETAAPVLFFS